MPKHASNAATTKASTAVAAASPAGPSSTAAGPEAVLVWFRNDLRIDDHTALAQALGLARRVTCAFLIDTDRLAASPNGGGRRIDLLRGHLAALSADLRRLGSGLVILRGRPEDAIPQLAARLQVDAVYCHHDDDPAAIERDRSVRRRLAADGRDLVALRDATVFEGDDLLTGSGQPYRVFTPYRKSWLARLASRPEAIRAADGDPAALEPAASLRLRLGPVGDTSDPFALPARQDWPGPKGRASGADRAPGASDTRGTGVTTGTAGARERLAAFGHRIREYDEERDYPAKDATSGLSIDLSFGTLSIREAVRFAVAHDALTEPRFGPATWLSELIWREFFGQILRHNPHVVGGAFRPEFDAIRWVDGATGDARLAAWRDGNTGYPLVDAGMRELAATGRMHNRTRMVVASFLVKDLGVDWRRGESWFAECLLDHDLAANNGNWQWVAGTGCDAQPWFRIFNPVTQSKRFDPQGIAIRRWVPELADLPDRALHAPWLARPQDLAAAGITLGRTYPAPVVDHDTARAETLARYKAVVGRRAAA